jgi:hypothetical protein
LLNGDGDSQVVAQLDDDAKPLGYYSVRDFQTIKVFSMRILTKQSFTHILA